MKKANSLSLIDLIDSSSTFRCIDLEYLIKNGTFSSSSQMVCDYPVSTYIASSLISTQTSWIFIRMFTCSPNSSSIPNPYCGCFPARRSVCSYIIILSQFPLQVSLTFLYVAFSILIVTHLLEIVALFKLASLKGNVISAFLCSLRSEMLLFFTSILPLRSWSGGYVAPTSDEVDCYRPDDGRSSVRLQHFSF